MHSGYGYCMRFFKDRPKARTRGAQKQPAQRARWSPDEEDFALAELEHQLRQCKDNLRLAIAQTVPRLREAPHAVARREPDAIRLKLTKLQLKQHRVIK